MLSGYYLHFGAQYFTVFCGICCYFEWAQRCFCYCFDSSARPHALIIARGYVILTGNI